MSEATEKQWMQDNGDGTITVNTCAWSPPGDHPVGCGLVLTIKDGRLVKVEGDENHPVTQGRLCPRCLALDEFVYSPDRVLYPMKRDPKDRGKDKWERITWDEAVDLVEERVRYIWDTYGSESIVVYHGTGREACMYAYSMAYAVLRTPNYGGTLSGASCYGPRAMAASAAAGIGYPEIDYAAFFPDRYDDPRYQLPDYLIFWGKMPLYSSPDGLFGHAAIDMMQRGTKLITVDPRISWAGTRAEYNLQLRPGTDAALVLGMMNILIQEDLYDHEFVEKWTYGFDELAARCAEYPVERVAEICGIKAEKILEVTRAIGNADRVTAAWGLALDMQANGNQAAHGFLCLMALLGSFDVPGGLTIAPLAGFNAVAIMGKWRQMYAASLPQELKDKLIYGGFEAFKYSGYGIHGDSVLTAMETGEPYKPRMAWFYANNYNSCMAVSPADWDAQFINSEFNVCQDVVMNPTAMAVCDLFLPVSSFVEHNGIVIPHFGRNTPFFGAINKAIEVGDCKSDLEINFMLGKRLNPEIWPWDSPEDLFSWLLEGEPYNMTFEEFQNVSPVQTSYDYRKYETGGLRPDGKPGFSTQTGRFEFWRTLYPQWGLDPLPAFEEPPMSPVSTPELFEEYPLILTTGQRSIVSFHSEHRQIPSLRECVPDPLAQIHPEDAAKYGISDGDWMCIENIYGKAVYKAQVVPIVKKGVVAATHGWWFPEEEGEAPNLYGVYKSNINELIPNNQNGPTGFGTNYKSVLCKVYRVEGHDYLAGQNYPEKLNKVWEERL